MSSRLVFSLISASLLFTIVPAAAEDWPAWRGPRGDGTSTETNVPTKWTATDNIAWKVPVPGIGHSSPIVLGDKIFVTTCLVDQGTGTQPTARQLLCLNRADGKMAWAQTVCSSPLE